HRTDRSLVWAGPRRANRELSRCAACRGTDVISADAVQEPGPAPQVCGAPRQGRDLERDLRGMEPRHRAQEASRTREAQGQSQEEDDLAREGQDPQAQEPNPLLAAPRSPLAGGSVPLDDRPLT